MCKIFKKIFKKKEKESIKIDSMLELSNLYVGILGNITDGKDNKYYWDKLPLNSFIAFKYFSIEDSKHDYQTYGVDVFTNSEFYFFHNYDYLYLLVGKVAINKCYPLSTLANDEEIESGIISRNRVQEILYYLNNPDKVNKKEDVSEENVTDPVLKEIINTSKKIKFSNILEEDKKYLIKMLSELGKYFSTELINISIKDNDDVNLSTKDSIYALKMEVVSKLNTIEAEINKALITGNISREFLDFDQVLKRSLDC